MTLSKVSCRPERSWLCVVVKVHAIPIIKSLRVSPIIIPNIIIQLPIIIIQLPRLCIQGFGAHVIRGSMVQTVQNELPLAPWRLTLWRLPSNCAWQCKPDADCGNVCPAPSCSASPITSEYQRTMSRSVFKQRFMESPASATGCEQTLVSAPTCCNYVGPANGRCKMM